MLRIQSGPVSQLECNQKCWLEAIGTVVLLAGVLDLAADLVTMAPFRITRSFSPFKCLFLSSETKFLCFSLSNLVLIACDLCEVTHVTIFWWWHFYLKVEVLPLKFSRESA